MRKMIIGCPGSVELAKKISKKTKHPFSKLIVDRFPDGEIDLRFKTDPKGRHIYLVQSLDEPDEKLIEVIFAAYTARDLGARRVTLIAPYLCYMRQDKRFRPYEAVSSRIMARLFNGCLDGLITIDPHLHRYKSLKEIFRINTNKLSANGLLADYIRKSYKNPIIIGPDEESYQWARSIAKTVGCEVIVLKKHRYAAESVRIKIKEKLDLRKKDVIIVDDMVSTGHTMMEVVKDARRLGAKRIHCVCIHGLFAEGAYEKLKRLGVRQIVSTDTTRNRAIKIDISGLISGSIKR